MVSSRPALSSGSWLAASTNTESSRFSTLRHGVRVSSRSIVDFVQRSQRRSSHVASHRSLMVRAAQTAVVEGETAASPELSFLVSLARFVTFVVSSYKYCNAMTISCRPLLITQFFSIRFLFLSRRMQTAEDGYVYADDLRVADVATEVWQKEENFRPFFLYSRNQLRNNVAAYTAALEGLPDSIIGLVQHVLVD